MRYLLPMLLVGSSTAFAQDLELSITGVNPGEDMVFTVLGANPMDRVRLARGNGLLTEDRCFGPGICFSVSRATHFAAMTADDLGAGRHTFPIPGPGFMCFQAVSHAPGAPLDLDSVRYSAPQCVYTGEDTDGDGIIDPLDRCEGFDDGLDDDLDGMPNDCDICPADPVTPMDDRDGDGTCFDECPSDPDNDIDGDGICGDRDTCPFDPDDDADRDGICGDVDPCPADRLNDEDGDGLCAPDDPCPSFAFGEEGIDWFDTDGDGKCDADDLCPDDPYDDCSPDGIFVAEGRNGCCGTEFGVADIAAGTYTYLGDMAEPLTGMSFGPDGLLYAVEACGFGCAPLLMTLDYETGVQTTTATSGESGSHSGFSWAGDGMLYGWTEDSDDFLSIDPWTGDTVQTSVSIGTADNCMAMDAFGDLYMMTHTENLYLIDPADPTGYIDLGVVSGVDASRGSGCTFYNGMLYKVDGDNNELWEIDVLSMTGWLTGIETPDGSDAIASARP